MKGFIGIPEFCSHTDKNVYKDEDDSLLKCNAV
jgi:hypothetical protein